MSDTLESHYALLLGLSKDWRVDRVELALDQKRVAIALDFVGRRPACRRRRC